MITALYARVSTDEQAEHGHSIDAQKERLIAYASSQGWDDYRLYVDEGHSGTTMDRPALNSLLRHIEQEQINTVIVYRLDRLSRRQRDVLFLLEDVFSPNDVVFKSVTEPFDTGTPLGKAMIGILAVFAQLERDTIAQRTHEGQRKRNQKGLWHGGRVPFGYDYNQASGKLLVNEHEARLVRAAFRRYLNHQSLSEIADWLSSHDESRKWSFVTVRQLLSRTTYLGDTHWGANVAADSHEPIIDRATFERVQKLRNVRHEGNPLRRHHLLSGILRCGLCGGAMYHRTYDNGPYHYTYYACAFSEMSLAQIRRRGRHQRCRLPKVRAEKIEPYVIRQLLQLAEVDQQEFDSVRQQRPRDQADAHDLVEQLQKKIADIDKRIDRWYQAFERGDMESHRASARVQDLEALRRKLVREFSRDGSEEESEPWTETLFEASHLIRAAWSYMTEQEQRLVLQAAIREVVVLADHEIVVKWNV